MIRSVREFMTPGEHRFRLPMAATAISIMWTIGAPDGRLSRVVSILLVMSAVLLTLHAAEMMKSSRQIAGGLIVASAVMSTLGTAIDNAEWVRGLGQLMAAVPIVWAGAMVVRWISRREVITFEAVVAGILVYMLVAMAFADLYGALADLARSPLFCTQGDGTGSDRAYFSLVTITTTGYGDFTSCMRIGRAVAVSEAVFGQIYLVTIISLLVGNMGRQRAAVAAGREQDTGGGSAGADPDAKSGL